MILGSLDEIALVAGRERHDRLRLGLREVEPVDHGYFARGDLGRQRLAERRPSHLGRHLLVVLPGRGTEGLAAALPLGRADRALAGPARALLFPRLSASARDLAPALGVVGARAPRRQLLHDRLVQQRDADGTRENIGGQLELLLRLALRVEHGNGRHATWPLWLFAAATWSASRSCAPPGASPCGPGPRRARE